MAKGKAFGRFEAALGVVGLLALGAAYAMVTGWNPLPALQDWLVHSRLMSEPEPTWAVTVADQPASAVVAGGVVVVAMGNRVDGYLLADGAQQWTREVAWSAVAGLGAGSVVVAGKPERRGYEALDPATGQVEWSDPTAIGAWTFTNLVIGLACGQDFSCVLTARSPASGTVRWTATVSGNGRPLSGANRPLAGLRAMGPASPVPQPVPPALGFPLDDEIQVIGTGDGSRLHRYRSNAAGRVTMAGGRAVVTSGTFRDDTCRLHVEGRDPGSDRSVWRRDGYNLHTSAGLGCDQRTSPRGGGGLIAAVSADDRDVLLDPATGAEVYRAGPGQQIIDTNGHLVLVRGTDGQSIVAIKLAGGGTAWARTANRSVKVAFGPSVVVVTDPDAQRLTVLSDGGTVLATVSTDATVLGYADSGLLVNGGRQVGLLSYGGAGR